MPDVTSQGFTTNNLKVYKSTIIGTAVGTPTILPGPGLFHGIFFPNRVASGSLVIYDSVGTSANVWGTIVLGTQTNTDPTPTYEFDARMVNGLTIVNSGNLGAIVLTGV